jgi:hypothetical protein
MNRRTFIRNTLAAAASLTAVAASPAGKERSALDDFEVVPHEFELTHRFRGRFYYGSFQLPILPDLVVYVPVHGKVYASRADGMAQMERDAREVVAAHRETNPGVAARRFRTPVHVQQVESGWIVAYGLAVSIADSLRPEGPRCI